VLAIAVATIAGSSAITLLVASPASASSSYIDTTGAHASYDVMVALFGGTQTDGTVVPPSGQSPQVNNIAAGQTSGSIPAGTDCNGVTFGNGADTWSNTVFPSSAAGNPAPNGASEGKEATYQEETSASLQGTYNGCYDIVRSSSAPSTPLAAPDTSNSQYYAFALDAVSFVVGSDATTGAGLPAGTPAQLTLQEVYDIYSCQYSNWDQVTVGYTPAGQPIKGANAAIYRYWPTKGSGTLNMAQNMLSSVALGPDNPNSKAFDPTTSSYNPAGSAPGDVSSGGNSNCKNGIYNYAGPFITEESTETDIAQSSAAEDAGAIFPYSVGEFVVQWNNSADYCSFCDPTTGGANFDPSLTIASLADLGTLTNDALPYQYSESATGNPDYPYPPYTKYTFTSGSSGNPFVSGAPNAVLEVNETVVNETNEWYEGYGVVQDLVPGIRYLYNDIDFVLPTYATVLQLVGFNNTGASETVDGVSIPAGFKSPLCADTDIGPDSTGTPASIITASGFVPLGTVGGPAGTNVVGGHCRELAG
jgi:hypothetical protein